MIRIYVEDLLITGDNDFKIDSTKLYGEMKIKERVTTPYNFAGIRIDEQKTGTVSLYQSEYIKTLSLLL